MAVQIPQFSPLQQARTRRRELMQYLNLDGSRYLLGVVVLLGLMSMIALVQTGVVATKGYAIVALEQRINTLQRENGKLHMELAAAQSLTLVRERAAVLGLRITAPDQVQHITLEPLTASALLPAAPAADVAPAEEGTPPAPAEAQDGVAAPTDSEAVPPAPPAQPEAP